MQKRVFRALFYQSKQLSKSGNESTCSKPNVFSKNFRLQSLNAFSMMSFELTILIQSYPTSVNKYTLHIHKKQSLLASKKALLFKNTLWPKTSYLENTLFRLILLRCVIIGCIWPYGLSVRPSQFLFDLCSKPRPGRQWLSLRSRLSGGS
jgi:hypothetical protein